MAKYDVKHACGHTVEIALFGKHDARDKKIEWLEKTGECKACYAKRMAAEAGKVESAEQLPGLSGSEKQIDWARSIRAKLIVQDVNQALVGDIVTKSGCTPEQLAAAGVVDKASMVKLFDQAESNVAAQSAASWWIDNRDCDLTSLVAQAVVELLK